MKRQIEKFDNVDTVLGLEAMNVWLGTKDVERSSFSIINVSYVPVSDGKNTILYAFITYSE